ncbi:alcohol dehydrogenase [Uliginosibacterium gangwonense]|uniref:alcohol dehydrogenase n=1 Tax=Uliginosibacterium gangwonense TaxID=392736 RepID=UPI00036C1FD9|nr:alcohol dehydrogenase [Uliginosibacterium gangwonense]
MDNFIFQNPTRVIFGKGQIAALKDELPANARVMVTYGGGSIMRNGVMEQVRKALAGRSVVEFGGIEPNPAYETLMEAVKLAKAEKIDYLLAVGGGSVVDGTKFIAAALKFEGADPWDILAKHAPVKAAVPLACVLTLPATGTEMNGNSVVSRKATGDKLAFHSTLVLPQFSILDPETTYSLPVRQVANGVVDAFVHTTEQYLTYPVDARIQDRFAEGILQTLIEEGPRALAEPQNYAVRANVMWAATQALNGLIGTGVPQDWATHMIGHELTAMHGLDHAQTLAIVLPALLEEQRQGKREKLLQFASRVWGLNSGDEESRITAAIQATRDFFERMGVPTRLSGHKLNGSSIPAVVAKLREHGMIALGERQAITPEVSQRILERAR